MRGDNHCRNANSMVGFDRLLFRLDFFYYLKPGEFFGFSWLTESCHILFRGGWLSLFLYFKEEVGVSRN